MVGIRAGFTPRLALSFPELSLEAMPCAIFSPFLPNSKRYHHIHKGTHAHVRAHTVLETGMQSHGVAELTRAGELMGKARAGLTFLQSLQKTEALPRKPSTSPQSRHWERPLPITFRCIVSSRSTRRLRHRTQGQRDCAS